MIRMKKGWFVFILYTCLVCAGVCSARAAAAEPDSGDVMLSENPAMFAGETRIQPATERPAQTPTPGSELPGDEENLFLQYEQRLKVTGFCVSVTKDKAAKLSWDRNIYAKDYRIYRASSRAGDYKLVKTVDQSCISYVDRGVSAKKKYFYKVRALGFYGDTLLEGKESILRSFYTAGIVTPRISVKKGQSDSVRYIVVELKYYEGKNIEIYISKNKNKFEKLQLVSNKIAKYKGRFKIKCMVKNQNICFKVRTYRKVGKKRIYSKFSNVKRVQV